MAVTRDQLLAAALTAASALRTLADADDVPQRVRVELLARVDALRRVLPADSDLTIDQRSLFASH